MATLVDRSSWFVLAAVWCVACSDGFASSSKGSPSKPDDGAGTGPAAGDPGGSGATGGAGGAGGSGGVGGGRSPSNGKLGGSTGLPTGGTSTGGSGTSTGGSDTSTGGSDTGAGGSTAATGGSDTSAGGSGPATGGSGPSAGGSSNQGGSDNGGSTSSGATGGSGGDAAPAGMGGSGPQAGSGSGAAPGQGGGSSSAGGSGGSSMAAGAPNSTGGSAPIGGCDNQLLANADFEAGPSSAWTEQSSWPGIEIIVKKDSADLVAEGVAPYGGNYLGWLGGIPDNEWDHEYVKLTQSVTLPSTAATLTLTGRRYIKSVDDPSEAFDVAYLEFATEADDLAWQAQEWTNQDTTNGWVPFTATTDVEPQYRGKKLVFVAYSNTDPGGQTSFFIDDLRLVAGCGR